VLSVYHAVVNITQMFALTGLLYLC